MEPTGADTLGELPPRRAPRWPRCSASATTSRRAARSALCPMSQRAHLFDAGSGAAARRLSSATDRFQLTTRRQGDTMSDALQSTQVPRRLGRRRRGRDARRRQRAVHAAGQRADADASSPRRAPSCACCAGAASCRATSTPTWPTSRSSPRRPASRCGSTTRAGRTCARRRRWPPTPAPGPDIILSTNDDANLYPGEAARRDRPVPTTSARSTAAGTRPARPILQARRQEVDRRAARLRRRDDGLPREHGQGGRLRRLPEGHRRLPEA